MDKKSRYALFAHLILIHSASAFSIDGVTVKPSGVISSDVPVILEILITTPGTPASLFQSTEVIIDGNIILINLYADAGELDALDSLVESIDLGTFPPNTYSYEIILNTTFDVGWGTRTAIGKFTVAEICNLPADVGPCDSICPRYFFNSETNQCEEFIFGCCKGNANNFTTLSECEATCGVTSGPSIPAVSDWGLIIMTLLILCAGTIVLRRSSAGAL